MLPIAWDGVPPSIPRHGIQVYTVPRGCTVFARLLAGWQGVWLHWLAQLGPKGRSLPCEGEGCPLCPDPYRKWYGYAPALVWRRTSEAAKADWLANVLELTEQAVQPLRELEKLAGLVVQLHRAPKANGRLELTILEKAKMRGGRELAPLPPPFDVRPILETLWGRAALVAARSSAEASAPPRAAAPGAVIPFPAPAKPTGTEGNQRVKKAAKAAPAQKRRKHL